MKNLFIAALITVIAITSCKKESSTESPKVTGPLLKRKILVLPNDPQYNDTTLFVYDNSNRLAKTIYKNSNRFDTTIYESANVLKAKTFSLKRELLGTSTYTLNNSGFITEGTYTASNITTYMKYEYNSDGLLKTETTKKSSVTTTDTTFYTYVNRNMVKKIIISWKSGSRDIDTLTFEHYSDITSTVEYSNIGQSFFPNLNTNSPKSKTQNSWLSDTFVYELDSKNRIVKETDKNAASGATSWFIIYEYMD